LRRLIHRAMQHDIRRRMASAEALLAALTRIHGRLTSETPEQVMRRLLDTPVNQKMVVTRRRVRPLSVATGVALCVGVACAACAAWMLVRYFPVRPVAATQPLPAVRSLPVPTPAVPSKAQTRQPSAAKAPFVSGPVAAPALPAPSRPKTLVEQLQEKYETTDLLAILVKEYKAGNSRSALALFDQLPDAEKASVEAQVYELRALAAAGDAGRLRDFAAASSANESEVYLAKARALYEAGRLTEAQAQLERAEAAPHQFMDYEQVKREVCYCRALCVTRLFDDHPEEANYKAAVEAWYQLRSQLRNQPDHEYNAKAVSEMQRIGLKFKGGKG
jgi:hypothetical protein